MGDGPIKDSCSLGQCGPTMTSNEAICYSQAFYASAYPAQIPHSPGPIGLGLVEKKRAGLWQRQEE
jgi:hypothetical protein